ncbi:MAG: C40 family peptidase [Coriobacteriia bacterium]|nr:C40 family peptidase [Coriobacteriia bacterium]
MGSRRGRAACSACALALAALLTASPPASAAPGTPEIRAKQGEASGARRALDEMAADLEERVEEYVALTEQLDVTRRAIESTQDELAEAASERDAARGRLGERAAGIYKSGGLDFVQVLLGTTSFPDLIARLDLLARVGSQDARLLRTVETAVRRVEAAEDALRSREAEQVTLRANALVKKQAIEAAVKRQGEYVSTLDTEVRRLVAEEEERQRRLAEERARAAAEAAARRAAERAAAGGVPEPAADLEGLPPGHPEVVDVALRYLGVPYLWGGSTPEGFDCSGLVQYCYARIGIPLPRTSRSQYLAGSHIPSDRLDLLRPGDLVFFGRDGDPSRVHHVGIYSGDGGFVHAPARGDVVRVSSLTERIAERGDYVGASRF